MRDSRNLQFIMFVTWVIGSDSHISNRVGREVLFPHSSREEIHAYKLGEVNLMSLSPYVKGHNKASDF